MEPNNEPKKTDINWKLSITIIVVVIAGLCYMDSYTRKRPKVDVHLNIEYQLPVIPPMPTKPQIDPGLKKIIEYWQKNPQGATEIGTIDLDAKNPTENMPKR